jgi:23S rRNA pseudouridine2605 synthase
MVIAKSPRKTVTISKRSKSAAAGKVFKKTERKVIGVKRQPKEMPKTGHESELIRINKYIASTGVCSRREADDFIRAGLVTVNGKLITELGVKVSPTDVVKYNGEKIHEERKVYVLMNKPKDYVTTVEDPHAKKTVLDLVRGACKERIYPVGRLDRNTTGVLLLTNDGELTKRLTHPKFEKLKIYHVHLNKGLKGGDLDKVATGINLEDGPIKADAISYIDPSDKSQVGIEIHSGRNHIVRRIFEHLGYEVVKLDRVYFAGLTKKNLHRGEWRFLAQKEITMLKMNAFK